MASFEPGYISSLQERDVISPVDQSIVPSFTFDAKVMFEGSRQQHRRKRGRARGFRFSRTFVVLLSLNVVLLFCSDVFSRAVYACCKTQECARASLSWVDPRTTFFTAMWPGHKTRNVAIYACISSRNFMLLRGLIYYLLVCPNSFYDPLYDQLFSVSTACISHECLQPLGRSHYIYAEFVLKTYERVTSLTISPPKPTSNGKIAVLLEPRTSPLYEYAVKQVMSTLGEGWSLQLFVSSENESFVRSVFHIHEGGAGQHIIITRLSHFGLDDMSRLGNRVQSAFSAHELLYQSIPSEHIFWFQLDVILRERIQSKWLQHAYVGSEWQGCQFPACTVNSCAAVCGGGNSGLSLRRKSRMLLVATRGYLPHDLWGVSEDSKTQLSFDNPSAYFTDDEIHDNSLDKWFEDDLQISYKLSKLNLLPAGDIPPRFAISQAIPKEGLCTTTPAGMHKPWSTPWINPMHITWLFERPFTRYMTSQSGMNVIDH